MFDFAPVGAACAILGVIYIATIGWRLIPQARGEHDIGKELFDIEGYIAELAVTEGAGAVGQQLGALDELAAECDAQFLGVFRHGQRLPGLARRTVLAAGDVLVVEAAPEGIEKLAATLKLEIVTSEPGEDMLKKSDLEMREVVVPDGARAAGRSVNLLRLLKQNGVSLIGVSRQGQRIRERLRQQQIKSGDVMLLM